MPIANASLILDWVGADVWPSPISQAGMFTHESRGIDITSAHCRSAGMWMTISVSDWSVTRPVPYDAFSPSRESEPITMMFSACGWVFTGCAPSRPVMSSCWMFALKWCKISYPVAVTPISSRAREPAPKAMIFRRGQCRSQCPSDRPAFWSMRRHTRPN